MSKTAISSGIYIAKALKDDAGVRGLVGDRVYPIVAPAGEVKMPYVVYRSEGKNGVRITKDADERAASTLLVVSAGYAEAVSVSEAVRDALEGAQIDGVTFALDSFSEDFNEAADVYIVGLVFDVDA